MNLLILRNSTREGAFATMREVKRLIHLRDNARMGGLEGEILRKKEEASRLFKKWHSLDKRLKEEEEGNA